MMTTSLKFVLLLLFVLIWTANTVHCADFSMDCKPIAGASTGLACKSRHIEAEEYNKIIEIRIRPMPGFLNLGGVTIVDLCEFPFIPNAIKTDRDFKLSKEQNDVLKEHKELGCMRRYCSQDHNFVSFFLDDLFLPITLVSTVRASFAFYKANFEMRCEAVGDDQIPENLPLPFDNERPDD